MKTLVSVAVVLVTALLLSSAPPISDPAGLLSQNKLLQKELNALTQRGLSYRIVDSTDCSTCGNGQWVEVYDPRTGLTNRFPLDPLLTPRVPKYAGLPTLTIDLMGIDTNQYAWKYHYTSTVPVVGYIGYPLQGRDVDNDGNTEVYGIHQTQQIFETRVYERTDSSTWNYRYTYPYGTGIVDNVDDIDRNGLFEIYARFGDSLLVFEQAASTSLPVVSKFRYRQWYLQSTGIPNHFEDMDGDGRKELVFTGSEPDSAVTSIWKSLVARYDSSLNNFRRVWGMQLPPGCSAYCTGELATGDFDSDGKMEFVTSSFDGHVYVVEHVSADSFEVTWSDSLLAAGRVAAGDVDGNGIEEFFVGGTHMEPDGYVHLRVYVYEQTGNNQYQPVSCLDIFPVGIIFVESMQTVDMVGDSTEELLMGFSGGTAIIKGMSPHSYALFFYKAISPESLSGLDVDRDGRRELLIGRFTGGQEVLYHTDVYRLDSIAASVHTDLRVPDRVFLSQNYPNPFNPSTTLSFDLPEPSMVSLVVYDVLGRKIAELAEGSYGAGTHTATWNAEQQASGVYFVRFTVTDGAGMLKFSKVNKLVLMK